MAEGNGTVGAVWTSFAGPFTGGAANVGNGATSGVGTVGTGVSAGLPSSFFAKYPTPPRIASDAKMAAIRMGVPGAPVLAGAGSFVGVEPASGDGAGIGFGIGGAAIEEVAPCPAGFVDSVSPTPGRGIV